jgi:hypothetical protein
MSKFLLSLNDFSSFIELYTGLLLAFSGLERLQDYVKSRIENQVSESFKTITSFDGFKQIEILNPDLFKNPKIRAAIDWIKNVEEKGDNWAKIFLQPKFHKVSITAAFISVFGLIILLLMGLTSNKTEIYISYFSIGLQEISYKILLIYSVLILLFVTVIFLSNHFSESFFSEHETTNIFIKCFLINLLLLAISLGITLVLVMIGGSLPYSSRLQNIAIVLVLVILIVCYPLFLVLTFTSQTLKIYHKFRTAEFYYGLCDVEINPSIEVFKDPDGKYRISKFFKDMFQTLLSILKFNYFREIPPFYLSSFYKRFRFQLNIFSVTFVFFIFSIIYFFVHKKNLENSVYELILSANNTSFEILKNTQSVAQDDFEDNLDNFYFVENSAYKRIDSIYSKRKKDLFEIEKDLSFVRILEIKVNKDKIDYDSLLISTKEDWNIIYKVPNENFRIRYRSDTSNYQTYVLKKKDTNNWKIVQNVYLGKIDTLINENMASRRK